MTSRERVLRMLNHQEADRVPIQDAPWEYTIRRWKTEGMPADTSPLEYFGYELGSLGPDISLQLPEETIEETESYRIYRDSKGAVTRVFKDHESVPETIDFTINSAKAWEENRHRWLWNDERVSWESALNTNRAWRAEGRFVQYFAHIGYDWIQRMVGAETVLVGMLQEPEWIEDMFRGLMDLVIRGADEMLARGFEFDGVYVADDLGYKNGTVFSPELFRKFELPQMKRLCDYFKERNLPVILHSCGNVSSLVPLLIEAGFSCLQPLEVKAGMDLVGLKKQFGDRFSFMGGIDVRAMADPDPAVIEAEIAAKIPVAKEGGGYIYHSDHSVPSNVSFAQYQRVMALVSEYGTY
jgi:uroporphyrinogen decarboxylase